MKLTDFGDLVFSIDRLGPAVGDSWTTEVGLILKSLEDPISTLREYLEIRTPLSALLLAEQSFDRASHYKMFLFRSDKRGWEAWAHFYKTDAPARKWARSIHNHRYHFASRILSGGFDQVNWKFTGGLEQETYLPHQLTEMGFERLRTGDAYGVRPYDIHSLDRIYPNTVTVLIRSIAVEPWSTEFVPDGANGGKIVRHDPGAGLFAVYMDQISRLGA